MAIKIRRARRQTVGRYKLKKAPWFDPFPQIPGTEPEKRIFAMLVEMRIFFIFQGQVPEFEKGSPFFTMAPPGYKPDFVLPEYRLIIDPFSPFHHSLEGAVERDVRKVAAYSVAGYAYYHPWAVAPGQWTWDQYHDSRKQIVTRDAQGRVVSRIRIYGGVNAARNKYRGFSRVLFGKRMGTADMLRSIPEIVRGPIYKLTDPRDIKAKRSPGYRLGENLGAGANAVPASNRARRKPPELTIRYGHRRSVRRS